MLQGFLRTCRVVPEVRFRRFVLQFFNEVRHSLRVKVNPSNHINSSEGAQFAMHIDPTRTLISSPLIGAFVPPLVK